MYLNVSRLLDHIDHFFFLPQHFQFYRDSLAAQLVKNPPAIQETPVQFLGQEDLLEKVQATDSSTLGLPWWFTY